MRLRMPPLQSFRDVLAGASPNRRTPNVHWPDFDNQIHARLWRGKQRICTAIPLPDRPPNLIAEPSIFVSMHDSHFGHFISETVPRLPQSLAEAPGLPLYFTAGKPMTLEQAGAPFRAVLDWLDVPNDRIRFIHQPSLFKDVQIAAQAEHLEGPSVAEGYIDLLEARISGKLPVGRAHGVTFVTRAALSGDAGRHAGEAYLVACLRELGVRVVYPEQLPLQEQLRLYAQSRHLIFSEGSAVHGRQLLGRIDHHVSILQRRGWHRMAMNQLTPRCASLTYVGTAAGTLKITDADGIPISHVMMTLYRVPALHDHFESLGIPLGRAWNEAHYRVQRDRDILAWVAALYGFPIGHWLRPHNSDAFLLDQLDSLELGHLRPEVAAIIRARDGATPLRLFGAAALAAPPAILPLVGERGIDLFTPLPGAPGRRAAFICFATRVGQGESARIDFHERAAGIDAAIAAKAAEAFERAICTDEPREPLPLDRDLLHAWQVAGFEGTKALQRLEVGIDALLGAPNALPGLIRPLYAYNRISFAVQMARILQPEISRRLASGTLQEGTSEQAGYALRMLGEMSTRGGEWALALLCHETSIAIGGDNPHRRRLAILAADRLQDAGARSRHLAEYRKRWHYNASF